MKATKILSLAAMSAAILSSCCNGGNANQLTQEQKEAYVQKQGPVQVFSHRGGRMEHDENTITAFESSYQAGYRSYETDIRRTADGVLVVTHDNTLDRTTNGSGKIEQTSIETVKSLTTKKGGKMLLFDELIAWIAEKGDMNYFEFELKTKPVEDYPEEILHAYCDEIVTKALAVKPENALFLFTSSDERGLMYIKEKYPEAELLLIVSKPVNDETIARCLELGIPRLGAKIEGTTRKMVDKAHDKGLVVSLWPNQSVQDIMLGIYLGSNCLCTDVPVATKTFLENQAPYLDIIY